MCGKLCKTRPSASVSACVCLSCVRSRASWGLLSALNCRVLAPRGNRSALHRETAGTNQLSPPRPLTGDFQRDVNLETGSGRRSSGSYFLGHTLKPSANQEVTAGHLHPIGHAARHQTDQLQAGWPRGRTRDVLTEGGRTAFFLSTKELQTLGIRQTHGLKRQKTHFKQKHTRAVMAVIDGKCLYCGVIWPFC